MQHKEEREEKEQEKEQIERQALALDVSAFIFSTSASKKEGMQVASPFPRRLLLPPKAYYNQSACHH